MRKKRINGFSSIERELFDNGCIHIAGVDEVGRGSIAGPVVASIVILDENCKLDGIADSKLLTLNERLKAYKIIMESSIAVAVSSVNSDVIDKINIRNATLLAMKKAIGKLSIEPDFIVFDGRDTVNLSKNEKAVIKGDRICLTVAAASIVAKVIRDNILISYEKRYPGYGFAKHKGYGTLQHKKAISENGLCPIHRISFCSFIQPELC
ncbi:MAG: ribonuclease HII [Candidatus Coatesbacteria bacterium]|nr:ribonuclease HII [Candidatus Coatesbacteria bacterium]